MSVRPSCDRFLRNVRCVEIGVGSGRNAVEMLKEMPFALFYFVDSYDLDNPTFQESGRKYSEAEREGFIVNIKATLNDGRANLIIEDSAVAALRFPDLYFDYIYIDAEHDYDSVRRDIRCWYPKLKMGGTIGGHDIGEGGVVKAVTEYFGTNWIAEKEDWYTVKK